MNDSLLAEFGQWLFDIFNGWFGSTAAGVIMALIEIAAVLALITSAVIILVYMERRICGFIQVRPGPNRVGPFGLLQTVADMLKLMTKEDIIPAKAHRFLWRITPILVFVPASLIYAVFPFDKNAIYADLNIGIFFVMAIVSQEVLVPLISGIASEDKYSFIGAMRAVVQMLSSEVPMAFALMAVVMVTGSLRMSDIVAAQSDVWFIVKQPLAALIFFITLILETNRAPFNLVEGESEIIAGPTIEYSGLRWALFYLAEYTNLMTAGILFSTLFLGGWQGPFLPGVVWLAIKTLFVICMIFWVCWTYPRTRIDQMVSFSWKILLPLTLFNIVATGIGMYIYKWMY